MKSVTKFEVNYNGTKEIGDLDEIFNEIGSCVYVVSFNEINAVKIGFSTNFYERINAFKTYAPFGIGKVFCKETQSPRNIESEMHKHFDSCRLNGEWFSCEFDVAVNKLNAILQSELLFDEPSGRVDAKDNPIVNYLRLNNFMSRIDLIRKMMCVDPELDYKAEVLLATAYWYKQGKHDDWIEQWFLYKDSYENLLDVLCERDVSFSECADIIFSMHHLIFGAVTKKCTDNFKCRDDLASIVVVEGYDVVEMSILHLAQVLAKKKIKTENISGNRLCAIACFKSAEKVASVM